MPSFYPDQAFRSLDQGRRRAIARKSRAPNSPGKPGCCSCPCAIPRPRVAGSARPCGPEDCGFRQCPSRPPAFEPAGDANSLRMVAAKSGVNAVDMLESSHHSVLGQSSWREPAAHVSERPGQTQHHHPDRAQPAEHSGTADWTRSKPEWLHIQRGLADRPCPTGPAMRVCPDRLCSADVDASAFHVLLGLPTLRIAIYRRKGAALKFLFIVVSFPAPASLCSRLGKCSCLPSSLHGHALYLFSLHLLMLSVSGHGTSQTYQRTRGMSAYRG